MLRYLKIFSWFLLTFGVVGLGATALGIDLGFGTGAGALGVMSLQVVVAATILWWFKLHNEGRLDQKVLVYGGWALLVLFVVIGQIWLNSNGAG